MRALSLILAFVLAPTALADSWPMKAHDVRRTGQSGVNGPLALSEARSWSAPVPAGSKLNIGATVTDQGVFVGSWGVQRRDAEGRGPLFWDKSDGKLYGFSRNDGASLWGRPLDFDLTPRCYDYDNRGPNLLWCGFGRHQVSYYNGTVEGQPAYDEERSRMYVGRGDGKLYAVDPATGQIAWRYVTFNPEDLDDPDGGGEVVTAPLVGPRGTVFFGTWAEGEYETNAFYAVRPNGNLAWRWPETESIEHRFYASPTLSPDAQTVYASTFTNDAPHSAAFLYAFRSTSEKSPFRWSFQLEHQGQPVFTTTLAVGRDGVVYIGGYTVRGGATIPVVGAVEDRGSRRGPGYVWPSEWVELPHGAQFTHGVALREEKGEATRLFVTTANQGTPILNARASGDLYAIESSTGSVLARYDPSDDDPQAVGSLTSPAIGANGTVYVGVRGRFGRSGINGRVVAVDYNAASRQFTRRWSYTVDGHIEWNHPAIGPDGGLYISSTPNAFDGNTLRVFDHDEVPDGTTGTVYGLHGLRSRQN